MCSLNDELCTETYDRKEGKIPYIHWRKACENIRILRNVFQEVFRYLTH